jgi:hypothetical protein
VGRAVEKSAVSSLEATILSHFFFVRPAADTN